jgi:hypothetical protein
MNYPEHFPHDCPPDESDVASGEFYRFIKKTHEIPLQEDFLSWREENPSKPSPTQIPECQACGISVYSSLDDVINLPNRIPRFRKMKVAKGSLNNDLGKIKNTPSLNTGKSHHTWWIPKNCEPWKSFKIIDLSNKNPNIQP